MRMIGCLKPVFYFLLLSTVFLVFPISVFAQDQSGQMVKGKVLEIVDEGTQEIQGQKNYYQKVKVQVEEGKNKGKEFTIEHGSTFSVAQQQKVNKGDTVVLSESTDNEGNFQYFIADKYRLNKLIIITIGFFILTIIVVGVRGFGSLLGLIISFAIIIKFIVPQILDGKDPLLITIIGALFIMVITIYLAHGFSRQTTAAVVATFLALVVTGLLSVLFVNFANLSGLGSEEAYALQFGPASEVNLRGLLLGGIIIGALGVLDDVTTTQSAAVFELAKTNRKLYLFDLARRGFKIGREHILSMVNTLVLAYAGASLAIFIFLVLNPTNQPIWAIINSEIISEEIIRALSGSIGLVLAVPLSTVIAAWFATR